MTMMLPDDLVFQILLWLPVTSLLRFKSVCKCWFSIIERSNFIDQHLHHHHLHFPDSYKENLLVVSHSLQIPSYVDISFLSGSGNSIFHVWENLDLPKSPLFPNEIGYGLNVIASCDGLICAETNYFSHILVFNPAIKQLKHLPELSFPKYSPDRSLVIVAGFGFDVKTNDYKVVRVVQELEVGKSICNVIRTEVKVYSLSTDSWITIDEAAAAAAVVVPVKLYHDGHCTSKGALFRNGIFCWLGFLYCDSSYIGTILLFDFSKEMFQTMPLPDAYSLLSNFILTLALLRDNIACIEWVGSFLNPVSKCSCNIWVLNEYGVKESWTKLYTVCLQPYTKPIGFYKNGEIICEEHDRVMNESQLYLCDLVTQELKSLPFQGHLALSVAVYKESLVSVKDCRL